MASSNDGTTVEIHGNIVARGNVIIGGSETAKRRAGRLSFNIPNLPRNYQVRASDLDDIRASLNREASTVGVFGLRGMGGIGKTVLATAVARDPEVLGAFPDGVVWLTFGRNASVLTKAAELATAITGQPSRFESADGARGELGVLTHRHSLLVVLDDLWEPAAADPFTGLGSRCRVLITTRDTRVLDRANASQHEVGLLALPAAREFLAAAVNQFNADTLPSEADAIIRQCGRLPLALAAVGALIRTGTFGWSEALQALEQGDTDLFDVSWLPDPEHRTLAVVLHVSVVVLPEDAKECFLACAPFQEDVAIPEAALLRIWSGIVPSEMRAKLIAAELTARSLVTRDEQRRYRIHDLYFDYLHHAAAPLSVRHDYLVERYRLTCRSGWEFCADDGYIVHHLPWHLQQANLQEQLRGLLFCLPWLVHRLNCTNINALIADCALLQDDSEAAALASALTLSAHLLARSPLQLAGQLGSRLAKTHGPTIMRLLNEIRSSSCFVPLYGPYLTPPGGAELRRFEGHSDKVISVAVLPNGRNALSASHDGTMRLWDLDSGAELHCFNVHTSGVTSAAVLPDGRRALSASGDGTLRLWDVESKAELHRFKEHRGRTLSITVLPDGRHALTASMDGVLRLWDIDTGVQQTFRAEHDDALYAVAVLPDKRCAVSASGDLMLHLWDIDSGAELLQFKGHTHWVTSAAVLPNGHCVLSGSEDATLRLWNIDTGDELHRFEGHTASVNSVAVLPDGRRAMSASDDRTLRLWDIENLMELRRFEGHTGEVHSVAVLPSGRRAISASEDATLRLWNIEGEAELRRVGGHTGAVWSVAALPDGRHAFSASDDETLRLWDIETGAELRRFKGHTGKVNSFAVLPDGRRALSGFSDGTLRLWDIRSGAELRRFKERTGKVQSVAMLPNGRHALSVGIARSLFLWDTETGAELRLFRGYAGWVTSVAVFPDGCRALSASRDDVMRLWDIRSGALLRSFEGHGREVRSVTVMPGSRRALSGSGDQTLRLWNIDTGAELRRFEGHTGGVNAVILLLGGRRALSASDDATLRLWDVESGAELARYVGDLGFTALAATPDSNRVLTGNVTGQVVPFRIPE